MRDVRGEGNGRGARRVKIVSARSKGRSRQISDVIPKLVKFVLIIIGACVAGVAQFTTWPAGKSPDTAQVVGIVASMLVGLGGLYALLTEQDASTAVKVADKALDEARNSRIELEKLSSFFDAFDRLSETYRLCLTARGALEQAGLGTAGSIDDELRALFELIARPLSIAAGFQQADRWTIGIYRAVPAAESGKAELRCIAHRRAIHCELEEARSWREGVGIAGIAYTNQRELVIPDLRAEGVQAVFGPRDHTREYDSERYVSMVAVPITVAGREKPWGVVNATSDRANHFSAENHPGFKTAEPLRALAAFVALAIAMRDAQDRTRASPVVPVPGPPPPPSAARRSVRIGSLGR